MRTGTAGEGWQMPVHGGVHAENLVLTTRESQICAVPPLSEGPDFGPGLLLVLGARAPWVYVVEWPTSGIRVSAGA